MVKISIKKTEGNRWLTAQPLAMAFEGFGDYGPELVEFQRDMFLEMIESDGMPAQTHAQGRLLFFIMAAVAVARTRTRTRTHARMPTPTLTHIRTYAYSHMHIRTYDTPNINPIPHLPKA